MDDAAPPKTAQVITEDQLPEVWDKLRNELAKPDPEQPQPSNNTPAAAKQETIPASTTDIEADATDDTEEDDTGDQSAATEEADGAPETTIEIRTNLWERIPTHYTLPKIDNARVRAEINWFVNHQAYLDRVTDRAASYLHYIVEEVERRGIPSELALLPVVESAFQPLAYSRSRAAGIWQFIPSTANLYGLKINWWYDGRRDISASTRAALDYLQNLAAQFNGDWLLALASYNAGEGKVARAVEKNQRKGKPTDFWSLNLPRETDSYVPRLLAIAAIVGEPEKYGVHFKPIADEPYMSIVHTGGQMDLALVAELAGVSLEEIYRLNPGFNRWATDPNGPHQILLPLDKVSQFNEKLASLPPEKRVRWEQHKVKKGETIVHIAKKYNTTVTVLEQINKIKGKKLRAGQELIIPVARQSLPGYILSIKEASVSAKHHRKKKVIHAVRSGDTLWNIARRYGVSVKKLAEWNGLTTQSRVYQGQRLVIRSKS